MLACLGLVSTLAIIAFIWATRTPALADEPVRVVRLAPNDPAGNGASGRITGRVKLRGEALPARTIPLDAPCRELYSELPKVRLVATDAEEGLADVVVYISAGLKSSDWKVPQDRLELREKRCLIEPYVSAVQTQQRVTVRNDDNMLHDVFVNSTINRASNHASLPKTAPVELAFSSPEFFIRLKCDVHPWEMAFVSVIEHPFFAVTDKDGKFSIPNVPAGKYTITARHRLAGKNSGEVQVREGEPASIELTLTAPNWRK